LSCAAPSVGPPSCSGAPTWTGVPTARATAGWSATYRAATPGASPPRAIQARSTITAAAARNTQAVTPAITDSVSCEPSTRRNTNATTRKIPNSHAAVIISVR
jgi:hypothetical protein